MKKLSKEVQEKLDYINVFFQKSFEENFLGKLNNDETRRNMAIHESIMSDLLYMEFGIRNSEQISFDVSGGTGGSIKVLPKNLYTCLIFRGIFVLYSLIEGKNEYIDTESGITYYYSEDKGFSMTFPPIYYNPNFGDFLIDVPQ